MAIQYSISYDDKGSPSLVKNTIKGSTPVIKSSFNIGEYKPTRTIQTDFDFENITEQKAETVYQNLQKYIYQTNKNSDGEPDQDQQDKFVTYAKKISKKDTEIEWNEKAQKVIAKINSLSPFPGAWFKHNGKRIKILEAELSDNQGKIGEVLTDNLVVGCNDKSIKINLIQKEGKTVLDAKSFLTGYKIVKGEMLR